MRATTVSCVWSGREDVVPIGREWRGKTNFDCVNLACFHRTVVIFSRFVINFHYFKTGTIRQILCTVLWSRSSFKKKAVQRRKRYLIYTPSHRKPSRPLRAIGSVCGLHTSLSFLFSLSELPIQSFTRVALRIPFRELASGAEEPADC